MTIWSIDRSRILSGRACKRQRYWNYHHKGTGIQQKRRALSLQFGSAFHEAAEDLLSGKGVEVAVVRGVDYLDAQFAAQAVDLEMEAANIQYGMAEQKAIAEALVRGWAAFSLERFMQDFEVISVEQEGKAILSYEHDGLTESASMVLMFRPDAIVREKLSGDLYIISWKTASTFGKWTIQSCEVDMQSISEVWGIEQHNDDEKIEGVVYLFATKGQRKMDDWLGFKVQNTPLAYGWVRKGVTADEDEWAHQYGWQTEEINSKTGKLVGTKLGKGFRKVSIWDNYPGGIKEWIDDLAAQRIEPRHINALEAIFPQMLPISRRADEIESWKRQTIADEERWKNTVRIAELNEEMQKAPFDELLDRLFPQSTDACYKFNRRCDFFELCHIAASKNNPDATNLYQIRLPNHPSEKGDSE